MSLMANAFRSEFKTLLETGFTKNGVQFFGTAAGGIFRVQDYEDTERGFKVLTKMPTLEEFAFRPWIAVHRPGIQSVQMVGGQPKYTLDIIMDIAFAREFKGVGDVDGLKEEDLAIYFEESILRTLQLMTSEFSTVKVQSISKVDSVPQQLDTSNTVVYGSRVRFSCECRAV